MDEQVERQERQTKALEDIARGIQFLTGLSVEVLKALLADENVEMPADLRATLTKLVRDV